jgi:hypothetical protein
MRPHLKSRRGCIQCKNRKVKVFPQRPFQLEPPSINMPLQCDESPNSCGACVKRRIRCSLGPPTPPPPSPRPQIAVTVSSLLDLELLHNFSTKTCLSMTPNAALQQFYRTVYISEALKVDYHLHCILGLSAFHLAQQHQEIINSADEEQKPAIRLKIKGYLDAAHAYHNTGLSSFRQTLTNITSENCHALFACSSIIAMTSFAQCCNSLRSITESMFPQQTGEESRPTIIKQMFLVRGTKSVLNEAGDWIRAGPMSPILLARGWEGYESNMGQVDEDSALYLDSLSAFFAQHSDPSVSNICVAAIELLRRSFAAMASGCDYSVVFFWPALVSPDFVTMLELNRSEALTVLASFCVLLHTQNWRWFIKGWPSSMLSTIAGMLDEQWRHWLRWPAQVMQHEDNLQVKDGILPVIEGMCCQ